MLAYVALGDFKNKSFKALVAAAEKPHTAEASNVEGSEVA